jgi:hypothetical protein
MSEMRRTAPRSPRHVFFWVAAVFQTAGAAAQLPDETPITQRHLDRLYRSGENAPAVRTVFFQDEEQHLCVALGIQRGPGEVLPGFLVFTRRRPVEGKLEKERLKFEFDKKAQREEGELLLWSSCLAVAAPERIPAEEVEITVRRARQPPQTFVTALPPPGSAWGLDLWRHAGGELTSTPHREDAP